MVALEGKTTRIDSVVILILNLGFKSPFDVVNYWIKVIHQNKDMNTLASIIFPWSKEEVFFQQLTYGDVFLLKIYIL